MTIWILLAALAIGGGTRHKQPAKQPIKPAEQTKVVWVCKGNSYMMLEKGFNPAKKRGCRKTKMKIESDKP